MLKNPEDRRARRTRRLLKESLLELMEQKHFSEISVRDVTDNADMNRTTFYLHYTDTTQLLQSMEEDLLAEAQVLVDAHIQETVADGTLRLTVKGVDVGFTVVEGHISALCLAPAE